MRIIRFAVFASVVAVVCVAGSAQSIPAPSPSASHDDQEKRAKLEALIQQSLEETVQSTNSLRLPENRAIAYAMLGDMYWRFDPKRGRELFRNVAVELSAYNADVEKDSPDSTPLQPAFFDISADPRYQAIPLIARHDAELATQVMLQTRRPAVARALANASQMNIQEGVIGIGGFGANNVRASQELSLEQQVAYFAADQDIDVAVRLVKDSLSKGVSFNVLPVLQKIGRLDEKKAADLAYEVVQRVLDSDMTKSQDSLRTGINFLQYATRVSSPPAASPVTRTKQFNFTDAEQKDIANKLVTTLLTMPPATSSRSWFAQVIPLVDKVLPDRSQALKQRQAEIQKNMPADVRRSQQRDGMFDPSTTADQIIAQLPKLDESSKPAAYAALQNKLRTVTDDAQAKKLIEQIPDDKMRELLQQQADSTRADREIQSGKLDEARKQIAQMSDRRQEISRYVSLALAYFKLDPETARSVLKDARSLLASYPESGDDLSDLMAIVTGYATAEPDTAFRLAEPAVDMMNEYLQASAVLSRYNKDRSFRNGELVFRPGGSGGSLIFRYLPQVQALGKADLERSGQLIDRFSRPDARIILRLYVLQGAMPQAQRAAVQ